MLLPVGLLDQEVKVPVDQDMVPIVQSMTVPSTFVTPTDYTDVEEPVLPPTTLFEPPGALSSDQDDLFPMQPDASLPDTPTRHPQPIANSDEIVSALLGKDAQILKFHYLGLTAVSLHDIV
jgi:hypothetical protein